MIGNNELSNCVNIDNNLTISQKLIKYIYMQKIHMKKNIIINIIFN